MNEDNERTVNIQLALDGEKAAAFNLGYDDWYEKGVTDNPFDDPVNQNLYEMGQVFAKEHKRDKEQDLKDYNASRWPIQ